MELKDKLQLLRKQNGYSQEQLADKLGIARQTLSKWENGLSVPDSDMLISMSKILETPVSTLLAPFFYLPGFRCLICAAAF